MTTPLNATPPGLQPQLLDGVAPDTAGNIFKDYDRITASGFVHFERSGADAESAQGQFVSLIPTGKEEPYRRTIKVSEDWRPLDLGWHADGEGPGLVFLENRTDRQLVNSGAPPSLLESVLTKVMLVRLDENCRNDILIPPGQFIVLKVSDWRKVRVCSALGAGELQVQLVAFPQ